MRVMVGETSRAAGTDRTWWAAIAVSTVVPVAVVALASAGRSWTTGAGTGAFGTLGVWALLLSVCGVVAVRVGWPPSPDVSSAGRRWRPAGALVIGGAAGAAALAAATARFVDAVGDDTTVADVRPSVAGWLAPLALVMVAIALGVATRDRRRAVVVAVTAGALLAGVVVGLQRPPVPIGPLSDAGSADDPGTRPSRVTADTLAAVDDVVYAGEFGRLWAIDERGRAFPWAVGDDLRPDGFTGHITERSADVVSGSEPVALFAHAEGLAIATDEAVFVVRPDGASRLLVALRHDRTAASLATLAALAPPVVVLDGATRIRGAGRDGGLGLVVVTDAGIVQVLETGIVRPVPAGASILGGAAPSWGRVLVQGRSDGSIVVAARCRAWAIAPGSASAELLGDWAGDSCADSDPVPIAVRRSDDLVVGVARDGSIVPVERFTDTALAESTRAVFDGDGRLVTSDADGVLRRIEVAR